MTNPAATKLQQETAEAAALISEAVFQIVAQARTHPLLKDFDDQTKLTCVLDGLLTGVFAVAFEQTRPDTHDEVAAAVKKLVPYAEKQARTLIDFEVMELQGKH